MRTGASVSIDMILIVKNMFAVGFDDQGDQDYELITAFEVFEHLVDPMTEIENMLKKKVITFFLPNCSQ
jgi:2-polyprenyl-3-methyl-5-hydroxy-6-metoxy-1,4-benzoquinol methylase